MFCVSTAFYYTENATNGAAKIKNIDIVKYTEQLLPSVNLI